MIGFINYLFDHPYNIWDFNLATESLRTTDDEYTAYIGIPVEFALQTSYEDKYSCTCCKVDYYSI